MVMLIGRRKSYDIASSEITPETLYVNRRDFIKSSGLIAGSLALGAGLMDTPEAEAATLPGIVKSPYKVDEKQTPFEAVTTYNNFYEFGTQKDDPADNAKGFAAKPWTVTVDGEVAKPGTYSLDDLIKGHALEERVYRMRCVEAWSMVIPWVGVPLSAIIEKLGPTSKAKYVAFETLYDPKRMPGQRVPVLEWPYREGLRMDEAMNPLTLLAVGLYGQELMPQNGAPVRLVTPWKYGFKGIKSIVKIHFTDRQPRTAWNISAPREYGFYANVNPEVDHPRWSQANERRIGEFFRRPTLMFNGYGPEVAHMYAGLDLRKNF
jgi:sulfoxide reductase catalytic subunit YedY